MTAGENSAFLDHYWMEKWVKGGESSLEKKGAKICACGLPIRTASLFIKHDFGEFFLLET